MKTLWLINSIAWGVLPVYIASDVKDTIAWLGVSFWFLALYAIEVYKEENKKK